MISEPDQLLMAWAALTDSSQFVESIPD